MKWVPIAGARGVSLTMEAIPIIKGRIRITREVTVAIRAMAATGPIRAIGRIPAAKLTPAMERIPVTV